MRSDAERKLAAIMFTDIAGYTALMAESEERGLLARARHRGLVRPLVEAHHGEWIESPGDESLSTFGSALDAVKCGLAIQARLQDDPDLELHIGIHMGDIVVQGGEISGDGVNIASRICSVSEGGALCVSGEVYRSIRNQPGIEAIPLGDHELKNVGQPVSVYAVGRPGTVSVRRRPRAGVHPRALVTALAAVGLLALAWWGWNRPVTTPGPIRSLAVLPLENLSGDPEQEYFADGMTDAMIGELARISVLRVTSRTSIMRFKQTRKSLPEIAAELGVDALIEGTVLRDGQRVRITAQLIDARSDHHLWANHYERELQGVLGLQREIASDVARQVQARLAPRPSSDRPVIPAAHEAYLKGRYFAQKHNPAAALRSREHYEDSMRIDPEYPLGYAGLADTLSCSPLHTWAVPAEGSEAVPTVVMDLALKHATRAIELDEGLPEAQTAYGLVKVFRERDWDEAERRIDYAIELNPSFEFAHRSRALILAFLGRLDEAVQAIERAREIDPFSPFVASLAGDIYAWRGDTDTAMALWRESSELDAAHPLGLQALGVALCRRGDVEPGLALLERAREISQNDPLVIGDLGYCHAISGRPAEARALLGELEARSARDWVSPVSLARIHLGLGERDAALAQLERGYGVQSYEILTIGVDDRWDPVRSDPRFEDLERRLGILKG